MKQINFSSYEIFVLMQLVKEALEQEFKERIESNDCRVYDCDSLKDLSKIAEKLDAMFESAKAKEISLGKIKFED